MTPAELQQAVGVHIDAVAHQRLTRFVGLLLVENQRVNLTATTAAAELWRRHICDSLALIRALAADSPRTLLDIGSGGGLPGLPLACVLPRLQVTLLDATRKKIAALERIIDDLELSNVRAIWGRAEVLAHDRLYREQFDLVTARAVAELPVLLEYTTGFIRPQGQAWFFKSSDALATEASAAERVARRCALEPIGEVRYRLPDDSTPRVLVGYRKLGGLAEDLPRPPGRARKRAL